MLNRNLKKPSSAVLDKALEFMSAFGKDDKKLKSLLEEMKEVQIENEKLLPKILEAQNRLDKTKGEIEKDARDLRDQEVTFEQYKTDSLVALNSHQEMLESKRVEQEDKHIVDSRDVRAAIDKNKESLKLLKYGQQQLATGKKIVEDGAHKLEIGKQELNTKRARLESILNQLKNIY